MDSSNFPLFTNLPTMRENKSADRFIMAGVRDLFEYTDSQKALSVFQSSKTNL